MLLILACAPTTLNHSDGSQSSASPDTAASPDTTVEDIGEDTATEDTSVDDITGDGNKPDDDDEVADSLFTLETVHQAEITLSQDAVTALYSDPYTYVEARLTFDGEELAPVALRIKGRLGSYRDLSGKPALKIDINRYTDQTLLGLEKLNFNNMVQDGAMTHERIAYALFNASGVVAPRVGYVWVTINGDDYGLYTNVEVYDDVWLKRTYDDPSGNLYDGDYHLYSNWSYDFIDFDGYSEYLFALDEGQDVNLEDIYGVTAALSATGDDFYAELDTVVDMNQFLHMWAGEAWLGHYDGYAYNDNNYRVYFDPEDGRARFHPWDPDWAFYSSTPVTSPSGELASQCWAEPGCRAAFITALDEVKQTASESGLQAQLGEAAALIAPYVEADPRREYSASSVYANQNAQMSWLNNRDATLENLGL